MLALILAGGEGSRLRLGEKALVMVHNRPMIAWVLEAFMEAGCEPIVVTSYKTPFTRNWCRANDVAFIDTQGTGYVEDLCEAVEISGEDGPLFTSAADIPCLTADIIEQVLNAYHSSDKPACSTLVPLTLCERYGMQPRYREEINGVPATPCALNIFMGSLVAEVQDELCLLLDEPGLAFNINTREELAVLEREFCSVRPCQRTPFFLQTRKAVSINTPSRQYYLLNMADADIRNDIYVLALENAVKHKAVPRAGAILGSVMGAHPELRSKAKEINALIPEILEEVAALSIEEREEKLMSLNPWAIEKMHEKKERSHELPDLPNAESGVVMRFAPNPSGPLHLGHARASVLNDYYVKKYGGKFYYRVEDTDPKRVDPAAYEMVTEDLAWLGIGITDVVYQSDRFAIYYEYARKLLKLGGAYMCTCDNNEFREKKLKKIVCPCREISLEENLKRFDDMLAGNYAEGEITLRVKTDIAHPDPAVRDFAAMRVLTSTPHPRKPVIFVYPLMNFSVAVDDHLLGMTHVIRGKDHIANTRRQEYIYNYFGWKMPYFYHYGRMSIAGLELSTSGMRKGINEGLYTGWDDIHLGTLRALARRGIQPEAVRAATVDIGMGDTDISFSWENLFAQNKAVIDAGADRYFFVPDAVEVEITGAPKTEAHAPVYPNQPERGERVLPFTGRVLLPKSEMEKGGMLRLKDLFNINITGPNSAEYAGDSLAEARSQKAVIVQWLPIEMAAPCSLLMPEGIFEGFCEPAVRGYLGRIVQFERVGFSKIDAVNDGKVIAYFTHR